MRLAYLDCFSGISGDMALGALVHAGADLDAVVAELEPLPIDGFLVEREEVEDHGILATRLHVKVRPQGLIRTYSSVRQMLKESSLPAGPRRMAGRVFHHLAVALGRVHGKEPELVTFHELGEIECMVEVIGCAVALHLLGVDRVFASAIPTGMGMVRGEHGMVPVPSPEVMELLQAVPTYTRGIPAELVTPVGAALVAALVEGFGDMPLIRADHVGYGAGHPRLDFPNMLRVVVGEEEPATGTGQGARLFVPEPDGAGEAVEMPGRLHVAEPLAPEEPWDAILVALADDPVGEAERSALLERLVDAGADEAWLAPVVGRGGRALVTVTAVASAGREDAVALAMEALPGAGRVRSVPARTTGARGDDSPSR